MFITIILKAIYSLTYSIFLVIQNSLWISKLSQTG